MVAPAVAMAGGKLANNPNRLGGVVAVVFSIISLIVGGIVLAVGLSQTPDNQSLIVGGSITLAIGVLLLGVGVWLATRKAKTTTAGRLQALFRPRSGGAARQKAPMAGTSFDESRASRPVRVPAPVARAPAAAFASAQQTRRATLPAPIAPSEQRPRFQTSRDYQPIPRAEIGRRQSLPAFPTASLPPPPPPPQQTQTQPLAHSESFEEPLPPRLTDSAHFVPGTATGQEFLPQMTESALRAAYERRGSLPKSRRELRSSAAHLAADPAVREEAKRLGKQFLDDPAVQAKLTDKQRRQLERARRTGKGLQKFAKDNPALVAEAKKWAHLGAQGLQSYAASRQKGSQAKK